MLEWGVGGLGSYDVINLPCGGGAQEGGEGIVRGGGVIEHVCLVSNSDFAAFLE